MLSWVERPTCEALPSQEGLRRKSTGPVILQNSMLPIVPVLLAFGPLTLISAASMTNSTSSQHTTEGSIPSSLTELPTESGVVYPSDVTITLSSASSTNATISTSSATDVNQASSTSSNGTETIVGTATRSSTTAIVSVDVKCNGYVEFCDRKYSNVTYVVAHNSPFHLPNNAASNQDLDVATQLDDGIRGLQSETHYVNDTVMLCHNSCEELNAGPLENYLTKVKAWLDVNRYEVVTILLGNEAIIDPGNYTAPVANSGIIDYVYTPPTEPMDIDGWPTLGDMVLSNKRVVVMLAYRANQAKIPWLLNMWSYQWQTPFSPTDPSFPCTVQRPPNQGRNVSAYRLYLANHNLNVELDEQALGLQLLVPDVVQLNITNANTTITGAASDTIDQCTAEWGRPPNFLLVDYYNYGNFNGSTLAAAAKANNVTYDVNSCCGSTVADNAAAAASVSWWMFAVAAVVMAIRTAQ